MNKIIKGLTVYLVVFGVILGGCAILNTFKSKGLKFSHKKHIEEGAECSTCHTQPEDGFKMAMPTIKKCMTCHEGIDEEKPAEKKIAQFFEGDNLKWTSVTAIPADVKFSHKAHIIGALVECESCHKGIKESEAISSKLKVPMGDCISCHNEKKVKEGSECATCHKEIRGDTPPPSHKKLWKERHGQLVKLGDDELDSQCYYCHKQDQCESCHRDEEPKNHNIFWKQRGHGITIGMDRDECRTCHQSDFCQSCHEETAPRTHRGTWGAPTDNHCLQCMEPLADQRCSVCHAGTPSHDEATDQPAWHIAGMNCRLCHVGANAPPHVDDGVTDCEDCHE